jgi:two-component system OmpR family sensor kinase
MVLARRLSVRRAVDDQPQDLRRQLVFGAIGLVTVASVLIALVSSFVVGRLLLESVDEELREIKDRVSLVVGDSSDTIGPSGRLARPGFPVGTLIAIVGDSDVSGAVIDKDADLIIIDPIQLRGFAGASFPPDTPVGVRVFGGEGEYRVMLVQDLGDSQVVVGLPLADIRDTIGRLNFLIVAIAIVVVVFAGALGAYGARMTLRPLDRMRYTAQQVTKQRLDRGQVTVGFRVPKDLADPSTEVGQLGDALNRMLDHVDDAFRTRYRTESTMRRFVQDASHELRTPLASIRGYSEFAIRFAESMPEDVGRALERIESESVRMTRLVDDLLTLARLDDGDKLRIQQVDLLPLVEAVVADAIIRGPDHHFSRDLPTEAVSLEADPEALVQVLTNLVQNARAHTPPGTNVMVRVTANDQTVRIEVEDNGPGVDPEVLPAIFERFRKHHGSRARRPGSTGLGLSIAQTIVTAHHGTLTVDSEPGRTVFEVQIPRQFVQTTPIPLS